MATDSVAFAPPVDAKETPAGTTRCPTDTVPFNGKCVSKGECCVEGVCPAGQVFEYGDSPACVPCDEAVTQQAVTFCVGVEVRRADEVLKSVYKEIIDSFPRAREKVKAMERSWISFRDKYCDAYAAVYEGGTVQGEVSDRCIEQETKRQIDRLKELRASLSQK
jgi:uncharacterized protein YecT (DUF1311 family)